MNKYIKNWKKKRARIRFEKCLKSAIGRRLMREWKKKAKKQRKRWHRSRQYRQQMALMRFAKGGAPRKPKTIVVSPEDYYRLKSQSVTGFSEFESMIGNKIISSSFVPSGKAIKYDSVDLFQDLSIPRQIPLPKWT